MFASLVFHVMLALFPEHDNLLSGVQSLRVLAVLLVSSLSSREAWERDQLFDYLQRLAACLHAA